MKFLLLSILLVGCNVHSKPKKNLSRTPNATVEEIIAKCKEVETDNDVYTYAKCETKTEICFIYFESISCTIKEIKNETTNND